MTRVWIIGRSGLLGSALSRTLDQKQKRMHEVERPFTWSDAETLLTQIAHEARRFAHAVDHADHCEIYWAAGIGTMGSTDAELIVETRALETLLEALAAFPMTRRLRLAFASSAGAIYAGSQDFVVDEDSQARPTTAYARAKLRNELLVREFAERSGAATLLTRFSTLYGSGQSESKPQGLLTHISRCIVRNQTIHIFVPLDTIRDYVAVDDAAAVMIDALGALGPVSVVTKIIASEQPSTIGEILSIFNRVARRPPRIVARAMPLSPLFARRVRFRSVVAPARRGPSTNLVVGIGQLLAAERLRYAATPPLLRAPRAD